MHPEEIANIGYVKFWGQIKGIMKDVQIANYDNTRQVMPVEYSVPQDVSTCPLRACSHGGGRPQLGEVTRLSILSLILI